MPFKITSQHTPDSASISEYQLLSIKRRKVTKFFSVPNQLAAILTKNFCAPPSPLNLPRLGPESRTVRDPRVEPSTLRLNIADGSILQDRTFHVNASYHGWFSIHTRTLHVNAPYRGQFRDLTTFFSHDSNNRQASGPYPEPGAALSDCSRRRCFRGH